MAYRRAVSLLLRRNECVFNPCTPRLLKSPSISSQTLRFHDRCIRATRTVHTGTPLMVAKLLSVDELFAMRSLQEYLKKMETEYDECLSAVNSDATEEQCNEDELRARRTRVSLLAPLIHSIRELSTKQKEFAETETLLKDEDPALRELAELERESCLQHIQDLSQKILDLLIPEDEADLSDLVLEVTAGIGGQEAMLFSAEMFDMYQGYAQHHGWSFDILEHTTSEIGGLRHASASISGPQSYKRMKFEAGVHRVQRVPKTHIGTKGRSEKIRTYNFAQDRITDHRIGMTVHDIKNFLLGEDLLDEMNSSLQEFSNQETLIELLCVIWFPKPKLTY